MAKKTKEKLNSCFVSRDISWLEFNRRVLMQAADEGTPILERLKFLSIYYSNLNEFFMVRVGALQHRAIVFPGYRDPKTDRTTAEELQEIYQSVSAQQTLAENVYSQLVGDFKNHGIEIVNFKHMSKGDELMVKKIFTEIRDFLAIRVIDDTHAMPFIGGNERHIIASLNKNGVSCLGLVNLYRIEKFRTFESGSGKQKVVILSDLVNYFAPQLFKKYEVVENCSVRVIRNADVFLDEFEKGLFSDELGNMKKLLKKRKRELPVGIQINGKISKDFRKILAVKFGVSPENFFVTSVPFDIGFGSVVSAEKEMKYVPRKPVRTINLKKGEYFSYLDKKDLLISFPYQSINPFIEILYEAADDPTVVSIKITLYRLSGSSKLAAALAYAADQGKKVLCLLELRARFDEQNNIDYSEVLEDAGCKVIYGLPNQKVHSKLCLITRNCGGEIRYITQIGTGNYNETTSEQYTDLSFITSKQAVGEDAEKCFDALERSEIPPYCENLITAPLGFKPQLLKKLDEEIAKGQNGYVCIKCNSMNDTDVMKKLIECSQAGVRVELFIRSICCLKPGLAGFSDNITSKSIVGRYLEHSRIYIFGKDRDMHVFIGSGDLLNRNTQRRVESFVEVTESNVLSDVLEIVNAFRNDMDNGWVMQPDGTYEKLPRGTGSSSHDSLYKYFTEQNITSLSEEKISSEKKSFWQKLFNK